MKLFAALFLFLGFAGAVAFAQVAPRPGVTVSRATPPPGEPERADVPGQMASGFFSLLQKNEVDQAYASLMRNSKIAERPDEVNGLKEKSREAIEVFGPVQGVELTESKNVGTRLLRRTYISLNRDFPLRWRFYFYLSDNVWRIIDLRVDDRVSGMFEELAEARSSENPP
ncbi:MAG: hypothetical protein M3463_22495 [Verrucomicrobiota bacterium]|nr:hypothetical protein [Verrucomicrobiota bacterium]